MVDSVLLTDFLGVIQRHWAITVCDNEYAFSREYLQSCRKCGTDELRGFVLQ